MENRALVKSGVGSAAVGSVTGCFGVLKVFLLALDVAVAADPAPRVAAVGAVEPFLPARITARPDSEHRLRSPSMLAYRHIVDRTRSEISFGAATASLRGAPGSVKPFVGPPGACISLWEVPGHGLVLALESLSDDRSPLVDRRTDPLQDRNGDGFRSAVDALLAPFGLTSAACLEDVFPGLNRRMCAPTTYRPLHEIVIHRHRGIGGREAIEGLLIEVVSSGGERVRDLVDGRTVSPDRAASRRWDAAWDWERVRFVDHPAQPGAAIAVREDACAVLFDLEAAAPDEGYIGHGADEMIYELLPWVAVRARASADYWKTLGHLRDHGELVGDRLVRTLDDIVAMQARKMERTLLLDESIRDDRFHSGARSTRLRTLLARRVAHEITALDAELTAAADVVEHALLRSAELRGARHTRLARGWSAAAAAIAVVALFAALAAVPDATQPTLFPHWLQALATSVALTLGVVTVAVVWRRP